MSWSVERRCLMLKPYCYINSIMLLYVLFCVWNWILTNIFVVAYSTSFLLSLSHSLSTLPNWITFRILSWESNQHDLIAFYSQFDAFNYAKACNSCWCAVIPRKFLLLLYFCLFPLKTPPHHDQSRCNLSNRILQWLFRRLLRFRDLFNFEFCKNILKSSKKYVKIFRLFLSLVSLPLLGWGSGKGFRVLLFFWVFKINNS